ncbi:hypothetical protein L208DRAFT_477665 [Tricholoma matsutake]|nr:hypothetical protein L208DRAFT_477665 [Tricholoma matsutake 945]
MTRRWCCWLNTRRFAGGSSGCCEQVEVAAEGGARELLLEKKRKTSFPLPSRVLVSKVVAWVSLVLYVLLKFFLYDPILNIHFPKTFNSSGHGPCLMTWSVCSGGNSGKWRQCARNRCLSKNSLRYAAPFYTP